MNYAIIMAAGKGLRMEGTINKVLLPLGNKPMLRWSVDAFLVSPHVDRVVVAVSREDMDAARDMELPCILTEGGLTRQESVKKALDILPDDADFVFIHDAARPFVSRALIDRVLEGANAQGAAIPVLPIRDTMRAVSEGGSKIIDRDALRAVQTPQCFRAKDIIKAHQNASLEVTDDAALMEAMSHSIALVDGDPACFKITVPWDLKLARLIAENGGSECE